MLNQHFDFFSNSVLFYEMELWWLVDRLTLLSSVFESNITFFECSNMWLQHVVVLFFFYLFLNFESVYPCSIAY